MNKYLKLTLGIIIGVLVSGTTVYAANILFSSEQLSYDNTDSELTATNAKEALDELYNKASNSHRIKDNNVTFGYVNSGTDPTTDYTRTEVPTYIAKNGDQKSVCITLDDKLSCFDNNNYIIEKEHVQQVFSDYTCEVKSEEVNCYTTLMFCEIYSDGHVYCGHVEPLLEGCHLFSDNSVSCYH